MFVIISNPIIGDVAYSYSGHSCPRFPQYFLTYCHHFWAKLEPILFPWGCQRMSCSRKELGSYSYTVGQKWESKWKIFTRSKNLFDRKGIMIQVGQYVLSVNGPGLSRLGLNPGFSWLDMLGFHFSKPGRCLTQLKIVQNLNKSTAFD